MSDIDLDAIRTRAEAVTPGPWRADVTEIYGPDFEWVGETERGDDAKMAAAIAEFIAHAREDVPALIAEIERLRAELAAFVPAVDRDGDTWYWETDPGVAFWCRESDALADGAVPLYVKTGGAT